MEFKIYRSGETELIRGCIQRKRDAQKRLYDIYSPVMYPLCCRYLKDSMEAEDVLVMAFTKLFDKIGQYKGEGSFEGWVKRIVINESLAHLRRQRSMFVVTELPDSDIEDASATSYDHLAEEDLLEMISELPSGYRTVFNLFAIDGYSHKEIAAQIGISENTSKSQLSRARVLLQKLLRNRESVIKSKHHGLST